MKKEIQVPAAVGSHVFKKLWAAGVDEIRARPGSKGRAFTVNDDVVIELPSEESLPALQEAVRQYNKIVRSQVAYRVYVQFEGKNREIPVGKRLCKDEAVELADLFLREPDVIQYMVFGVSGEVLKAEVRWEGPK